ncbi:hypothetical protein D5086_002499 [Populus alba]|uniref:Uncharacterized protein n=1 Tax=Populus alba TaxID=43335 RepID=A0ACC4D2J3_POPAL
MSRGAGALGYVISGQLRLEFGYDNYIAGDMSVLWIKLFGCLPATCTVLNACVLNQREGKSRIVDYGSRCEFSSGFVAALHDGSAPSLGPHQMTHFLLVGRREYFDLGYRNIHPSRHSLLSHRCHPFRTLQSVMIGHATEGLVVLREYSNS